MKKIFASLALFTFMSIPSQAFAWTYDGIGSLNPFTLFGTREYKNTACGCQKVEKCKKPKLTKCEKLHGVKIKKADMGEPCGCAAPVQEYVKIVPMHNAPCNNCQRAF